MPQIDKADVQLELLNWAVCHFEKLAGEWLELLETDPDAGRPSAEAHGIAICMKELYKVAQQIQETGSWEADRAERS